MSKMELESQKRLKTQIMRLIRDSGRGNTLSSQIVGSISPNVFAKIGLENPNISERSSESFNKPKDTPPEAATIEAKKELPPLRKRVFKRDTSKVCFGPIKKNSEEGQSE